MLVSIGETYTLKLYKRDENSPYINQDTPDAIFKGKPVGNLEKKAYRVQLGVESTTDSIFIMSTNLPKNIKDGDKVEFLGEIWTVSSVGYYFDQNRIINASIMSNDAIINRCPKGITLQ